jgi:hypothetical protein
MTDAVGNHRLYKQKGRGHSPETSIRRFRNAVPDGEPFTWATLEMKEFPAWRAIQSITCLDAIRTTPQN